MPGTGKKRLVRASPHEAGGHDSEDKDTSATVAPPPKRAKGRPTLSSEAAPGSASTAGGSAPPTPGSSPHSAADSSDAAPRSRGDDSDRGGGAPPTTSAAARSDSHGWAEGQWDAWKEYCAKEQRHNVKRGKEGQKKKTMDEIVAGFNKICTKKGWKTHTYAAIRSHRRRIGEADASYNASPLTDDDRRRAQELFKDLKSWYAATDAFNAETGRAMSKDALVQAVRRRKPDSLPESVTLGGEATGGAHPWTDQEIQLLKKFTNKTHKELAGAYEAFTDEMESRVTNYQPRRWKAFLRMLGAVRSAVVEKGRTDISPGRLWDSGNNSKFDELAKQHTSETAFVKAAAKQFGCSQKFALQLFRHRKPPLSWQVRTEPTSPAASATADTSTTSEGAPRPSEDATRRPAFREDMYDDAEPGMENDPARLNERDHGPGELGGEVADAAVAIVSLATGSSTHDLVSRTARQYEDQDDSDRGQQEGVDAGEELENQEPTPDDTDRCGLVATSNLSASCQRVGPDDSDRGVSVVNRVPEDQQEVPTSIDDTDPNSSVTTGAERQASDEARSVVVEPPTPEESQEHQDDDEEKVVEAAGDQPLSLDWLESCGFQARTPWITEPNTPTPSELDEDLVQPEADGPTHGYAPDRPAYDPQLEEKGEGATRPQLQKESVNVTIDDLIALNAQYGSKVDKVIWKERYYWFCKELFHFKVDNVLDEAERDDSVGMNQGPPYQRLLQEWKQSRLDAANLRPQDPRFKRPTITDRRITELAVMIAAVNDCGPYRVALLRHFGYRLPASDGFGECYGDKCCLQVDFGKGTMIWTAQCRHWLYFSRGQAYMDQFRSAGDYKLSLALSCASQAKNQVWMARQTLQERANEGGPKPYSVVIDVISVIPASQFFDKYFRLAKRPYAGVLIDCMVVMIPGEAHYGGLQSDYREATRPTTFGAMWSERGDKLCDAVLCRYNGQNFWLANLALPVARQQTKVRWVAEERLLTHSRRCGVLEECHQIPMVQQLAARQQFTHQRHDSVVRLIERGIQYRAAKTLLDPAQMKALDLAVKHVGILPIRGPFGCGKTRLIALIVAVLVEAFPHARVFVTSETNSAIDENLRRLATDGRIPARAIVRLGEMPRGVDEKLRAFYLEELVAKERMDARRRGLTTSQAEACARQLEDDVLEKSAVVLATTATLGREQYQRLNAQVVVNDEGAQTTEASLIQALRSMTMTLIPIGDLHQLPGRVELPEGQVERYEPEARRHKMGWSIIHAMNHEYDTFPGATLTAQYRAHAQIGQWLSGFYDFALDQCGPRSSDYLESVVLGMKDRSHEPASTKVDNTALASKSAAAIMRDRRIALISCPNEGLRADGSEYWTQDINRAEIWKTIELLLQVVRELKKVGEPGRDKKTVIIITPYNAQKDEIASELGRVSSLWRDWVEASVHTIDSSQGREADVAIVSMVRVKGLGFLAENKARTLVALSRARDYLFVIANRDVFEADSWWEWLYTSAMDPDVEAVQAIDHVYSDEAEKRLREQRRLREVCSPLRG